jgi:hypothetical protein
MDERKEALLEYANMHEQARRLQDHFNDSIDDQRHPMVYNMQQEMHGFVESFALRDHPRDIDERAKKMQDQLRQLKTRKASFMSSDDVDHVHGHLGEMREHLRKFEDY